MNKVRFLPKIALIAGIAFALAFTFSCSTDPDDNGKTGGKSSSSGSGSYPSCNQATGIMQGCDNLLNVAAEEACEAQLYIDYDYDRFIACLEAVYKPVEECYIEKLCNGNDIETCEEHFEQECGEDGGGSGYPSCNRFFDILEDCEEQSVAAEDACDAQFDIDDDYDRYIDCLEAAYEVVEACVIEAACNGNSVKQCQDHFEDTCGF